MPLLTLLRAMGEIVTGTRPFFSESTRFLQNPRFFGFLPARRGETAGVWPNYNVNTGSLREDARGYSHSENEVV
jgi:hypothetical protein